MRVTGNDTQVVIDAPEGAIVKPRKEKKAPAPHKSTGYKVLCNNAECLQEHPLEVAGPYFMPKLSYYCPTANVTINWPSHKGQAMIRKRIKGAWSEDHIGELMKEMREEAEKAKKEKRRPKELPSEPEPKPKKVAEKVAELELRKPKVDKGLLDALREKYG